MPRIQSLPTCGCHISQLLSNCLGRKAKEAFVTLEQESGSMWGVGSIPGCPGQLRDGKPMRPFGECSVRVEQNDRQARRKIEIGPRNLLGQATDPSS